LSSQSKTEKKSPLGERGSVAARAAADYIFNSVRGTTVLLEARGIEHPVAECSVAPLSLDYPVGYGLGRHLEAHVTSEWVKTDKVFGTHTCSAHKKRPPIAAARHICTVAGQVPGGLFDIDDDRLMFSAFKMAHTRSATHCSLALIGMGS
jgi:hypothetical protein